MLRILSVFLAIGMPLVGQDKPLAGKPRAAFIKKIAKSMAKVQTVVAEFEQEKHYSLFDGVLKQKGMILYRRPDRLRWEIQQPFRSILIVAGTEVAKFEFRKGKRKKLQLGRAKDVLLIVMDQIRGWFRGDFEKSDRDYRVDFFDQTPARIVMRPRSKSLRKAVHSIELVLAKDLASVTQVTIREQGGDKTVMRFTRHKAVKTLDAEYFDVAKPRDYTPKKKPAERPKK